MLAAGAMCSALQPVSGIIDGTIAMAGTANTGALAAGRVCYRLPGRCTEKPPSAHPPEQLL